MKQSQIGVNFSCRGRVNFRCVSGTRAAVDQTLTRLTREGLLLRVGRGLYAVTVQSRFGDRPPATQAVVDAIESTQGEVIVASGAAEANALGLTTQVHKGAARMHRDRAP